MIDARHKRTIACGLILAAVAVLPALSQDLPSAGFDAADSETDAADEMAGRAATRPEALPPQPAEYPAHGAENCPPPREGPLRRWRRRQKARWQDKLWGYPEEFVDAPLGVSVDANVQAQRANGRAARMILRQYDFIPGTDRLKPQGKIQVAKIAAWLPTNGFAVLVEPSGKGPKLDEARRQAVVREFTSELVSIPSERVIVARPGGHGLEGPEATMIQSNRDKMTTSRGASGSGGTSSSGGGTSGASSGASTSPNTGGR